MYKVHMTQLEETSRKVKPRLKSKALPRLWCGATSTVNIIMQVLTKTHITAYLNVTSVQANVYGVSNTATPLGYPLLGRLQLFSIPQLHRPGKSSQVFMQSGS